MDYEKKYKEALERAKEIYNRQDATDKERLRFYPCIMVYDEEENQLDVFCPITYDSE